MSKKKQVKVRLEEDEAREFKKLADQHFDSNVEAARQAFQLLQRAHGMTDAGSIEDDITEIDRQMQRVRREANQELARLFEKREELVETLEWRQQQEDLVEMTIEEIAEGLASTPNQNLHAYAEQVEFLIAHSDGPHDRTVVQARVNEYASSNGLSVSPMQLYPDQWEAAGGTLASTDGTGEDTGPNTEKYGFEESEDDE